MPMSQHAARAIKEKFTIELSALLMELDTSSEIAPVSTGISPLFILSITVNARLVTTVTIVENAISTASIKIEPRKYCFSSMCPRPGNTRPDRSAALIDLVIRTL